MSQDFDLLIVGGGIVGCTLALSLADAPLRIGLVESATFARGRDWEDVPGVAGFDLRVSTLNPGVQRQLQRLAVWELLESGRLCPFAGMEVWDAEGSGSIRFDASEAGEETLGWAVEHRLLLAALRARLEQGRAVQVYEGAAVRALECAEAPPRLVLEDGSELRAGLVAAADGARSRVREFAGFSVRERDCGQRALVAAVETERPHGGVARQVFLPTGPLAFLPLRDRPPAAGEEGAAGDSHFCSIVWSADLDEAEHLRELPDADFARELGRAFEHRLGEVRTLGPRADFPLWQRHAQEYFQNGVVLLGDAAHVLHPLAGQGLNLGMRDAAVLAEELQAQLACGIALEAPPALRRYQHRRRMRNAAMLAAMRAFQLLFGAPQPALRLLRNIGIDAVDRMAPLKRLLMMEALGSLPD